VVENTKIASLVEEGTPPRSSQGFSAVKKVAATGDPSLEHEKIRHRETEKSIFNWSK
jgi:hypothetical protein